MKNLTTEFWVKLMIFLSILVMSLYVAAIIYELYFPRNTICQITIESDAPNTSAPNTNVVEKKHIYSIKPPSLKRGGTIEKLQKTNDQKNKIIM